MSNVPFPNNPENPLNPNAGNREDIHQAHIKPPHPPKHEDKHGVGHGQPEKRDDHEHQKDDARPTAPSKT